MAVEKSASSEAPIEVLARFLSCLAAGDAGGLEDVVTSDCLETLQAEIRSGVAASSGAVRDRLLKDARALYITVVRADPPASRARGYVAELHWVDEVREWRVHGLVGLDARIAARSSP